jgi:hypothetical protein
VSVSPSNIPWLISAIGKEDVHDIMEYAKTSLTCVVALLSTIYMFSPVLNLFLRWLNYLTDALGRAAKIRQTMSQEDAEAHLKEEARIYPQMTRIFIHPDWVGLLDFETRLPSAVERAIKRAGEAT